MPRVTAYFGAVKGLDLGLRLVWLRSLLREAFPWRFSFEWRGDPVDEIMRAPPPEREAILESFFASLGMKVRPPRSPTSSRASSSN
jgi:hypothetical protein